MSQLEHNGGISQFVDDLSYITGKTGKRRNRAIDAIIAEDFPNLKLAYRPQYSPYVNYGMVKRGVGTHPGENVLTLWARRMGEY